MKLFVGTSGWLYDWNKEGTLDWYVRESGLNAVELNASFYRFPFPNQVKHWADAGKSMAWSIKVNRLITHQYKLSSSCYGTLGKFLNLFKPLDGIINYYLFQLPSFVTPSVLANVEKLLNEFPIADKFAIEPRSEQWFNAETYSAIRKLGVTFVSTDSPLGSTIEKTSTNIYLRMHGRASWYNYKYSGKELASVYTRIAALKPKNAFIFFNNDHSMLQNAREMFNANAAYAAKSQ